MNKLIIATVLVLTACGGSMEPTQERTDAAPVVVIQVEAAAPAPDADAGAYTCGLQCTDAGWMDTCTGWIATWQETCARCPCTHDMDASPE